MTDQEPAGLVERLAEAARAPIAGDIEGELARIAHADDSMPMSPNGSETVLGFVDSDAARAGLAAR